MYVLQKLIVPQLYGNSRTKIYTTRLSICRNLRTAIETDRTEIYTFYDHLITLLKERCLNIEANISSSYGKHKKALLQQRIGARVKYLAKICPSDENTYKFYTYTISFLWLKIDIKKKTSFVIFKYMSMHTCMFNISEWYVIIFHLPIPPPKKHGGLVKCLKLIIASSM